MQDESEYLDILFAEMSALECTHQECTEGGGGARYKTPPLEPQYALELLQLQWEDAHSQQVVGAGGGANKVQLPKSPDQRSVEDAARRTSSSSPENGINMSDPPMKQMAPD
jgi:hypothetical protein